MGNGELNTIVNNEYTAIDNSSTCAFFEDIGFTED